VVGETVREPAVATGPIGDMEALEAPLLVQVSVDEPPAAMAVVLAENEPVGGGMTVTVVCFVTVPPAQDRVSV
jgi:hypothetical protein